MAFSLAILKKEIGDAHSLNSSLLYIRLKNVPLPSNKSL